MTETERFYKHSLGISAPPGCPPLPPGVSLVRYAPKSLPVLIAPWSVVTDVGKFIQAYLQDLGWRLAHPQTYACAPLLEILAKLAEVGVELEIEPAASAGTARCKPGERRSNDQRGSSNAE